MNNDSRKSFTALWSLAQKPDKVFPLIEKVVQPITSIKEETFQQLIRNLESNRFVLREIASAELVKLGGAVRPRLEKLLKQEPTEDFRTRIEEILKSMDGNNNERVNRLRCLELLERINSPEAKKFVEKLAIGDLEAEITIESKKILSRWNAKRE
jgi:hypothetical protein